MNLIGCLDTPSQGQYWLNGHKVSELNDDELARIHEGSSLLYFRARFSTVSMLSNTTHDLGS